MFNIFKKDLKGFTLIELLVVIAIIGILATVVIGSVNSARQKGADAGVRANLSNIRASSELFYDIGQTYTGVCADSSVLAGLLAANKAAGGTATTATTTALAAGASPTLTAFCSASGTAWAAATALKTLNAGAAQYYCVDSTGTAKSVASVGAAVTVCP